MDVKSILAKNKPLDAIEFKAFIQESANRAKKASILLLIANNFLLIEDFYNVL